MDMDEDFYYVGEWLVAVGWGLEWCWGVQFLNRLRNEAVCSFLDDFGKVLRLSWYIWGNTLLSTPNMVHVWQQNENISFNFECFTENQEN